MHRFSGYSLHSRNSVQKLLPSRGFWLCNLLFLEVQPISHTPRRNLYSAPLVYIYGVHVNPDFRFTIFLQKLLLTTCRTVGRDGEIQDKTATATATARASVKRSNSPTNKSAALPTICGCFSKTNSYWHDPCSSDASVPRGKLAKARQSPGKCKYDMMLIDEPC